VHADVNEPTDERTAVRAYEAVVFDVDGVLLRRHADYPDAYREAIAAAFDAFDVEPSEEDLAAFYGGSGETIEGMEAICERHGIDLEAFWPERERRASALQQQFMAEGLRALYDDVGVLETLASTHAVGLVSNNQQATIEALVEQFDLGEYVDAVYGREPSVEGYRRCKPDVHYLERALEELGTRSALFVGDSDVDVVAAHRAGLDSAFLARESADVAALSEEPTYAIGGLTELADLL